MIREGNTKDMNLQNIKFKVLGYGPPGSGKTYFGTTAPKPYFIALDRGLKGVAVRKMDIPYVEVDTYQDIMTVLEEISTGKRAKDRETIVIDHLSDVSPLVIDATLQEANKKHMDKGLWGVAKDKLRVMIHELTSLSDLKGFHTIMLAHEQIEKSELRGGTWGTPNTIGQLAYNVGGWFDLFLYFQQEVRWQNGKQLPEWKMHTVKYVDFVAKDRLSILQPTEDNNFDVIVRRFKEKLDATD